MVATQDPVQARAHPHDGPDLYASQPLAFSSTLLLHALAYPVHGRRDADRLRLRLLDHVFVLLKARQQHKIQHSPQCRRETECVRESLLEPLFGCPNRSCDEEDGKVV